MTKRITAFDSLRLLLTLAALRALAGAQTPLSAPPGYSVCSNERTPCTFSGTIYIAYGANGRFLFWNASNLAGNNRSGT